jgi:Fur family ferric uptake transcriptional regulator
MPPLTSDQARGLQERFRRWLRDHRLPVTRPREAVAATLFAAEGHPSADGLARALKARGEAVGTATLYRTLELLLESGLVRAHDFGEGLRRFEPVASREAHGHFVCRRCGGVSEFTTERLERVLPFLADEAGFQLERPDVTLHGVCRGCQRRLTETPR